MRQHLLKIGMSALALSLATGCSTLEEKRKIDYRNTPTLPTLEVPPGLTGLPPSNMPGSTGSATYSGYAGEQKTTAPARDAVLPQYPGIKLARDGQARYLVVNAEPGQLWDQVREFILKTGLVIADENQTIGLIETDWAENRAVIASEKRQAFAKWLASFYSTGTRDKYRLRLERGAVSGTTEIYLSHRGVEEIEQEGDTRGPGWRPRPSDPDIEAEMLQRLAVHLAGEPAARAAAPATPAPAAPSSNARLARNGSGATVLALQDSLDRAWRRVGLSLDRIGFTVEDRDRSKGIYYVRYNDPDKQDKKGFFSSMFGSDDAAARNQYQVHLAPGDSGTSVVEVLDKNGTPETSKTGERILSLLYDQLK